MKNRLFHLVVMFSLLLTLWVPTTSAAEELNKNALNGVVYIETEISYNATDGEETFHVYEDVNKRGSGFFIGVPDTAPQYLITNYHVIQDYVEAHEMGDFLHTEDGVEYVYNAAPSRLLVVYSQDVTEEAFVVDYDKVRDIAILRLDKPTQKRIPLLLAEPGEDLVAANVYALGYPKLSDDLMSAISSFSPEDLTVTSGVISRVLTQQGTGTRQLQMDVPLLGGNSGGPLVKADGSVVGINTSGAVATENMNYAVSVEDLIPLLNKNSIAYEFASQEAGGLGDKLPLIITLAVVAVGIAAVIVIVVVVRSKKKGAKAASAAQAPRAHGGKGAQKPIVRIMSPQHRGLIVPVTEEPALIGRDVNSCKIVFYEPAPGVSARHCSVAWSPAANAFLVTDVGSTYGTYLANGQKLVAGMAYTLQPGDAFYVGDRKNVIRVELG